MWSQDQHRFPQSPTNRISAGYVKKHSTLNLTISKWGSNLLGVWSYLNHKDTLASVQTFATCSISRGCTFAWRRQSCPSRRDWNWRRHATPYGYWPLLRSTNIDDGVTHSVLVPLVHKTRTLQNFSCWCSTDTDDYRSTRYPRILFDNRWFCLTLLDQKKSHKKLFRSSQISRHFEYQNLLIPIKNTHVRGFQFEWSITVMILDTNA